MRPAFLDDMSWAMAEVYGSVTDRILANIARHFKYIKDGEPLPQGGTFGYQARKLAELGQLNRETVDIIAQSLDGADEALRASLEAAIRDALKDAEPALRSAAEKGLLTGPDMIPPEVSPGQTQAFRTYYRQSADRLNLVNTVMLESTQAAYTATVSDIVNRVQRTQSILNTGAGEVVTGVQSWNEALRGAVRKMVDNGLTGFIDHAGHRWSPEAYVAMDIRTTMHNTANAAVWERCEEYGSDIYQVSTHAGARPLCYPWQGKLISRTDNAREVPDIDGSMIHVYAQSETSYGQAAGLFGVNCGHYPIPFIPGFSALRGAPQSEEENAQTYAESQQQRALERRVRDEKLKLSVMQAQGADEKDIQAQKAKVRAASADVQAFCDETGRTRRRSREYTPVNASFEGAKTPPFGAPMANVINEYRAKAKPGKGSVTPEPGYKISRHDVEKRIAEELVQTFGGDITLRKEFNLPGVFTPDYSWNGRDWEQKTVSTAKAANEAVRHGLKQIMNNPGGLVITKGNASIDNAELIAMIAKRVKQGPVETVDIIVTEKGQLMKAYRMTNKK